MEKSIKINIAGVIFQINEDAYEILRDYLQAITYRLSNIQGGSEMIDDIEARIAELFQSKPSWQTAVISKEEVEEMISTMGSPEDIAGDIESDPEFGSYSKQHKRLSRNTDNAILGGVCSGISDYTGIDAVWIRIIFILFTLLYLSGAIVYIILWIALPRTGMASYQRRSAGREKALRKARSEERSKDSSAEVGNAVNEIFKAFGKFFIILFRVIVAIIGVAFIIAGFSGLFSFILIALFHSTLLIPPFFDDSVFYLPHFLYFIADPALSVWLTILISLVVGLPLVALIYWGIRMTFQFRTKDLLLNVAMLIIWILSCVALSIVCFTQGVSFSDSQRSTEHIPLPDTDTIYVKLDDRVSSLDYRREIHLPFEPVDMYLGRENDIIYISPELNIYSSDDGQASMEILRYSSGHSRSDALNKARNQIYDFSIDKDTIKLDEYFTLPEGERWSGSHIKIRLYIPDDMTIFFDEDVETLMHDDYFGCGIYSWEAGDKYWLMTDGRLEDTD